MDKEHKTPLMDQLYLEYSWNTAIRTPREVRAIHILCKALEATRCLPISDQYEDRKTYIENLLTEARDVLA